MFYPEHVDTKILIRALNIQPGAELIPLVRIIKEHKGSNNEITIYTGTIVINYDKMINITFIHNPMTQSQKEIEIKYDTHEPEYIYPNDEQMLEIVEAMQTYEQRLFKSKMTERIKHLQEINRLYTHKYIPLKREYKELKMKNDKESQYKAMSISRDITSTEKELINLEENLMILFSNRTKLAKEERWKP